MNLLFIEDDAALTQPGIVRSLYDPTAGTGGMLSVADEHLASLNPDARLVMFGQELNPESYAICKADMLIKGEGENADHIVGGAEWSTLSHDAFPGQEFDFMVANPPYGKSWKKDLEAMGGKDGMRDPRFKVMHAGEELSLVTRSSDGYFVTYRIGEIGVLAVVAPTGVSLAMLHHEARTTAARLARLIPPA